MSLLALLLISASDQFIYKFFSFFAGCRAFSKSKQVSIAMSFFLVSLNVSKRRYFINYEVTLDLKMNYSTPSKDHFIVKNFQSIFQYFSYDDVMIEKIMTKNKFARHLSNFLLSFSLAELFGYEVIYFTKDIVSGVGISIIIFVFSYMFLLVSWIFIENLQKCRWIDLKNIKRVSFSFRPIDKFKSHMFIIFLYWAVIWIFGMLFFRHLFVTNYPVYTISYDYNFSKNMIFYGVIMIIPISLHHFSSRAIESNYDENCISDFVSIRTILIATSIAVFALVLSMEVNYFNYQEFLKLPNIMQEIAQVNVVFRDSIIIFAIFLIYLHYLYISRFWQEFVIIKLFVSEIEKINKNLISIPDTSTFQEMFDYSLTQYKKGNPQIFQNTPVYSQYLREMLHFNKELRDKLIEFYDIIQTIHRNETFSSDSMTNDKYFQMKAFFENVKKAREQVGELEGLFEKELDK
ncbi:MAG: hypothetical protein ABSG49_04475 [Methanoregula sp.]|uniref:hypothetical protein n=1 Tax=Methanoregula sp. TaxID=2052170 RepID=UPI003C1B96DD